MKVFQNGFSFGDNLLRIDFFLVLFEDGGQCRNIGIVQALDLFKLGYVVPEKGHVRHGLSQVMNDRVGILPGERERLVSVS